MNPVNTASIVQAARGPILLITVGVLMVIDYNTSFSFSRTWPALIIVFGLLKLLERMAGPPQVPPYVAPYTTVPPGFEPPPGGYQTSGYQVPPQNPGGHPQ